MACARGTANSGGSGGGDAIVGAMLGEGFVAAGTITGVGGVFAGGGANAAGEIGIGTPGADAIVGVGTGTIGVVGALVTAPATGTTGVEGMIGPAGVTVGATVAGGMIGAAECGNDGRRRYDRPRWSHGRGRDDRRGTGAGMTGDAGIVGALGKTGAIWAEATRGNHRSGRRRWEPGIARWRRYSRGRASTTRSG